MKKYAVRLSLLLSVISVTALTGCQEAETPKAKAAPTAAPSIGREYGETLHGAINQANEAKTSLEKAGKVLDHANDASE